MNAMNEHFFASLPNEITTKNAIINHFWFAESERRISSVQKVIKLSIMKSQLLFKCHLLFLVVTFIQKKREN